MPFLNMLLAVAAFPNLATAWTVGQEVDTTSGRFKGIAASLHREVSAYLGIPYVAAPVGDLRWRPPQPFPKSNVTLVADQFGPDCPALPDTIGNTTNPLTNSILSSLSQLGNVQSEDCLTVNIWTKPQIGETKKAVLVWIYGGGFTTGSSNNPVYDGSIFAEKQDVVAVTFNYRLNIFGYPSAPGLESLNPGLLDQRAALEWVKANVKKFGGDSNRITLFGESSGSRSVDNYAYAWADAKDPIVNGFICESGSSPWIAANKWNPQAWFSLSGRLGCGGPEKGNETIACMRTKLFQDILEASKSGPGKPELFQSFVPVTDEKVVFSDYDKRAAAGRFIQKPLLIGNNDNEYGLQGTLAKIQGKPYSNQSLLIGNLGYVCSAKIQAQRRKDKGVKAWRYRWMGVFPNQNIADDAGAWHTSEIPHVFGTIVIYQSIAKATDNQLKVSSLMNSAWAAFAKDPETGLSKLGWPLYNEKENSLILLAENNGPGATFAPGAKYDSQCGLVNTNILQPS